VQSLKESGLSGVDQEDVAALHRDFKTHCRPSTAADAPAGKMALDAASFVTLCSRIGLKNHALATRLFAVWDRDGSGEIDFVEFMSMVALVRGGSVEDKLRIIFDSTCN
jgi:Ca2+-binding EF-hand superfamily protein